MRTLDVAGFKRHYRCKIAGKGLFLSEATADVWSQVCSLQYPDCSVLFAIESTVGNASPEFWHIKKYIFPRELLTPEFSICAHIQTSIVCESSYRLDLH